MSTSAPSTATRHDVVILVPIYRASLDPLEHLGLAYSLRQLNSGRTVVFIGPSSLDISTYTRAFPGVPFIAFPDHCFSSIPGYNRLLMSEVLYEHFSQWEFMLILQTDALLLRDDLNRWTASAFDYIGAPWPNGLELNIALDRFSAGEPRPVRVKVGNGGLSLRRNRACLSLLREFPQSQSYFVHSGSSEDLFFSFMGSVSRHFVIPNEFVASEFSLELAPRKYFDLLDGIEPMGGHAVWKYDPDFWIERMDPTSASIARSTLAKIQSTAAA